LLVFSVFLFFFGLGNVDLTDPDETFYAQTAREMLDAGEWSTPLIFGKPQFEKPVLYYLLVRASYMAFGVNEFAARAPSALFGILGILGIYLLGRALYSPLCGFLSGLVMATSAQYIVLSRACVTDMVLCVFILYCFLFFLMGWAGKGKAYYILSSIMAALAVLTKGPIGILIPGIIIIFYLAFSRQLKEIKKIPVGTSVLVFLVISLPWYIAMWRIHGDIFTGEFFGLHNITRFLVPEHRHGTSPFFYIPVLIGGFFPWSFFLPFAAWYVYKYDDISSKVKAHGLFLFLWFLAVFLFFSVSRTKLVTYIFPLFPVLAVVTGRFWEMYLDKGRKDRRLDKFMNVSYAALVVFSVMFLAGVYFFIRHRYPQASLGTLTSASILISGFILSTIFFGKRKKTFAFYSIIIAVFLIAPPLVLMAVPPIGELESSKVLSLKFNELSGIGDPIAGESDHRRGIAFYTGRTDVVDIHPYQNLVDFVSRDERVWGIIQRKHYFQLKGNKPRLAPDPVAEFGKYMLITNKPLEKR
jgi:4-amino-4-deoxy-L-arabinose transferase-like glycosyltransferase